ncbi:GLOBIN domain-containing protein [Trichostrongylus colubriformis]|uniref:GLOBIN domain-containing protein n=1 Tax=Trichostrongylus colubriformis TaxID=6319 RepID=A0AAN8ENL0_TRICO
MISSIVNKLLSCGTDSESASELSEQEIAAVKDAWTRARNSDIGVKILSALIEKKPNFAAYYGFKSAVLSAELRAEPLFIAQANRIQNFLETTVSSLGISPDDVIHKASYHIGQIHYYKGVNFGADNWLVFKKTTIEQVMAAQKKASMFRNGSNKEFNFTENNFDSVQNGNQRHYQALVGWNKLMSMVIREMKRGFLEEARRNCGDEKKCQNNVTQ